MHLLHAVAFSKLLPWFQPTNVITLKTQLNAENACVKRSSQRSLRSNKTLKTTILFLNYQLNKVHLTKQLLVFVYNLGRSDNCY